MTRLILTLFLLFILSGCKNNSNFKIGFTPAGLPITLSINSSGIPSVEFSGKISTAIGPFAISYDDYIMNHRTYVELVSRNENKKYVFELTEVGEKVSWETNKYAINTVENKKYSTIVTVESEEISSVLHKRQEPKAKPNFPEQSFSYFYLTKKLNKNVNWEIKNVKDFFGDIFFGIVWILCVVFDLFLIIVSAVIRFFWWIILLIGYLFGI